MRSICKKGSATLVAVLALCALTAASASAAQWYVGGKALTGSEKLAETVKVEEAVHFTAQGVNGMAFTCHTVTLEKGEIVAGAIAKFTPRLTACETTSPKTVCEINSTMIGFPAEATLTKGGSEDTALITGLGTKKNIWQMEFGGGDSCGLAGLEFDLRGHVTLALRTGQLEEVEQIASFVAEKESTSGLKMEGTEGGSYGGVTTTGEFKLKLASGKGWSFR